MDQVRPDLQRAMDAVQLPEVQEMSQRLAKYGLAVTVPHMHGQDGGFFPLPEGTVALESGLQVTFKHADDPEVREAIPVAWRGAWDEEKQLPTTCAIGYCSRIIWHPSKI